MVQRKSGLESARRKRLTHLKDAGNEASLAWSGRLSVALIALAVAAGGEAQDRRVVTQPTTPAPPYCKVLQASLPALSPTAFVAPRAFDDVTENSPPDTARINTAILQCSQAAAASGFATPAVVKLSANGDNMSFLAGPILMQSGVTLLIDPGVT